MNKKDKILKDLNKISNTNEIKCNLVRSSLYLFSYELLKNTIINNIKDFYLTGFNEKGFIYSKSYKEKVENRKIDGKQNIFLSSLHWLEENGAILKDDIIEINAIREMRNTVAHQLDKILVDSDFNLDANKVETIFEYINKIERWWIKEVEIPTNPDFDEKEILSEEILPGKVFFYEYIKSITDDLIKAGMTKDI